MKKVIVLVVLVLGLVGEVSYVTYYTSNAIDETTEVSTLPEDVDVSNYLNSTKESATPKAVSLLTSSQSEWQVESSNEVAEYINRVQTSKLAHAQEEQERSEAQAAFIEEQIALQMSIAEKQAKIEARERLKDDEDTSTTETGEQVLGYIAIQQDDGKQLLVPVDNNYDLIGYEVVENPDEVRESMAAEAGEDSSSFDSSTDTSASSSGSTSNMSEYINSILQSIKNDGSTESTTDDTSDSSDVPSEEDASTSEDSTGSSAGSPAGVVTGIATKLEAGESYGRLSVNFVCTCPTCFAEAKNLPSWVEESSSFIVASASDIPAGATVGFSEAKLGTYMVRNIADAVSAGTITVYHSDHSDLYEIGTIVTDIYAR